MLFDGDAIRAAMPWRADWPYMIDVATYAKVLAHGSVVCDPEVLASFRLSASSWSSSLLDQQPRPVPGLARRRGRVGRRALHPRRHGPLGGQPADPHLRPPPLLRAGRASGATRRLLTTARRRVPGRRRRGCRSGRCPAGSSTDWRIDRPWACSRWLRWSRPAVNGCTCCRIAADDDVGRVADRQQRQQHRDRDADERRCLGRTEADRQDRRAACRGSTRRSRRGRRWPDASCARGIRPRPRRARGPSARPGTGRSSRRSPLRPIAAMRTVEPARPSVLSSRLTPLMTTRNHTTRIRPSSHGDAGDGDPGAGRPGDHARPRPGPMSRTHGLESGPIIREADGGREQRGGHDRGRQQRGVSALPSPAQTTRTTTQ